MELYSFHCPACGAERTATLRIVGRRVRCPICEATVTAPPPTSKRERQLNDTWTAEEPASAEESASVEESSPPANVRPFDPYYKWLAIPPAEHPPNFYRLLGVPLFEEDLEVIESSADRQMAHVKTQAGGRHADLSQKLLNELAGACNCLLNLKKKKAYDENLRRELAAKEEPVNFPVAEDSRPVGSGTVSDFAPVELTEEDALDEPPPAEYNREQGANKANAASSKSDSPPLPQVPAEDSKVKSSSVAAPPQVLSPLEAEAPPVTATPVTETPVHDGDEQDQYDVEEDEFDEEDEIDSFDGEDREDAPVKLGRGREPNEAEMDMTPMVDVTFLLLIFFMVTAAFALQRSKELPTPNEDQPSTSATSVEDFEEDPDVVVVRVDSYNAFHVTTPDWEEEAPSQQELLIKLREARQGDSAGNVPTQLLVIANGEADYERVITALDAGPAVGMERVKLVTVEEDDE